MTAQAAVTFVANDFATGSQWRTPQAAKAGDADGDNIYGSAGYFLPSAKFFRYRNPLLSSGSAITPDAQGITAMPGYITGLEFTDAEAGASWGGEFSDCGTMDEVPGSLGLTGAGILPSGAGTNVLHLKLKRTASPAFRLTLVFGNNPNPTNFFEHSAMLEDTKVTSFAGIPSSDDPLGMSVTVDDGSGAVNHLSGDSVLATNTAGYTTYQLWDIPAGSSDISITVDVAGTTNTVPRLSGLAFDTLAAASPSVLIAPVGGTIYSGNPIVLDVTAGGTGIRYQWLKNSNSIAGATNWEYSVLSSATSDSGSYQVVISNALGSVTSAVAAVTVLAPPVTVLLQDTLGGASGTLSGRTPDTVGTSNWLAGTVWSTDGSEATGTGTGNAFLPFVPQPGRIYSLSAEIENTTTDGGSWTALGFANGTTLNSQWHTVNSPVGWWLARGDYPAGNSSNPNQTFIGPGTGSGSTGTGFWPSNMVTYKVILDTTPSGSSNWTFTYLANGNVVRAATAFGGSGPTITRVGFGMINASGSSIVRNFTLSQQIPFSAPFITTSPVGGTNFVGETRTFSVVAGGSDPLSYQWQKNSNNIVDATNATLVLNNLQTSDAGSYRVVVTNPMGSTNSASASILVITPVVDTIYEDGFSSSGDLNGLFPSAAGARAWNAATNGAWTVDGSEAVANTTSSANAYLPFVPQAGKVYTLSADIECTAGSWIAIGFASSNNTTINWQNSPNNPVGWSLARVDYSASDNQVFVGPGTSGGSATGFIPTEAHNYSVLLDTRPASASSWTFTFLRDGAIVSGPTAFGGSGPSISTVGVGAYGLCYGYVRNFKLTVASASAFAPSVLTQPSGGGTVLAGASLSLGAYVDASRPVSYQWQKNSNNISGATAAELTIPSLSLSDSGYYRLTATNAYGGVTTTNVLVTVVTNMPVVQFAFDSGDVAPGITVNANNLLRTSLASVSPAASGNNFTGAYMRNGSTGTAHESSTDNPANIMNSGAYDFVLDTAANPGGYDITSVVTYSGWSDRAGQNHSVYYRQVGSTNYVLLGSVVNTSPGDGSLRAAVTNMNGGIMASGVAAIRVVVNQTYFVYREIEVDGTPVPQLKIALQGGNALLKWPETGAGYSLLSSPTLGAGASWQAVGTTPTLVSGTNQLVVSPASASRFFRLSR
jgi:hypothetical protein